MREKQNKSCKRKKCPYYNERKTNKCEKCEWNPNAVWIERKWNLERRDNIEIFVVVISE